MKAEKNKTENSQMSAQEHIELINSRKHSKTWDAIMKYQGSLIVTDPNLM
jgi:hypothetical protein